MYAETIDFPNIAPAFSTENSPLITTKPNNIWRSLHIGVQQMLGHRDSGCRSSVAGRPSSCGKLDPDNRGVSTRMHGQSTGKRHLKIDNTPKQAGSGAEWRLSAGARGRPSDGSERTARIRGTEEGSDKKGWLWQTDLGLNPGPATT